MFSKYSNSFLHDFNLDEFVSTFPAKDFVSFEQDCFIYSENDQITNIYIILSGKVEILKTSKFENEPLYCVSKGDLVGIGDALTGDRYCNSAYVLEKSSTISIEKSNFLEIIKTCDEFRLWILKYLSTRISSLG